MFLCRKRKTDVDQQQQEEEEGVCDAQCSEEAGEAALHQAAVPPLRRQGAHTLKGEQEIPARLDMCKEARKTP